MVDGDCIGWTESPPEAQWPSGTGQGWVRVGGSVCSKCSEIAEVRCLTERMREESGVGVFGLRASL